MPASSFSPDSFQTFGDLLKYLRRRERLTQLELSIAVGYSDAQVTRLEKNQRRPDIAALKALFVPALNIQNEPEIVARFLELAQSARQEEGPAPGVAPYKGLLFFDEMDSGLFFGRETLTANLAKRVVDLASDAATRFLTVVGASGSGKSSLVRAGLAVALKHAGWDVQIFTPGAEPFKALETQLEGDQASAERLVVLVDQFEETFTLCHHESERASFIERLVNIAQEPSRRITVVIALRADFYSHGAQYPLLRQVVAAEQEYIGQMSREELRRAIEEPARRGGWEFEPGLVDVLLNDIGAQRTNEPEPGALPLLSHALLATWEHRRGRVLTLDGYHASGGVHGAIAETAESIFTDQLNASQQEIARNVFLRLTELGEGTEDTRRRALLNELVHQAAGATQLRAVINTLAEARLITLNEDSAEVAHEALIREWERLHAWLTEDRQGLILHRHLTESAYEWATRGHDPADLYRGARLAQAREWALTHEEQLNASEQDFLAASIEAEQRESLEREAQHQRELEAAQRLAETQSRAAQQLRRRALYLAGVSVIAIVAALAAGVFARIAQVNEETAVRERQAAEQQALIVSTRGLYDAANLSLETDPELSILLALEAVKKTYSVSHTVLPEAEDALRRALQVSRLELTLRGHTDSVWSAVFSPNGTQIASASQDTTVNIWDAATGQLLRTLMTHTLAVNSAVYSPDGKRMATASDDHTAKVWDASSGEELFTLEGHTDKVYRIVFSPDGSKLATVSADGTTKVWNALTGKELLTLAEEDAQPLRVAFRSDGLRIAVANTIVDTSEGWVTIWDATTGKKLLTSSHQTGWIRSVAFSPDGAQIAAAGPDRTATIWHAKDGTLLLTLDGHTDNVTDVAYSLDGARLITGSYDRQVKVWDLATGQELFALVGHKDEIYTVAFSPDGNRVVSSSLDQTAKVWSLSPSWESLTLVNGPPIASDTGAKLAYSPDGTRLAVAYAEPTAKVWDMTTGKLLFTLTGHTDGVNCIAYNFDGTRIATVAKDGTAKVWDAATGKELQTLPAHRGWAIGVAFSPDGSRLATAGFDKVAKLWDLSTGESILTLADHDEWLLRVAFSPDGSRIATSSFDGTAIIWDASTGKKLFTLTSHKSPVVEVIFSPDNTRLATSSFDGSAKLWDVASGEELLTLAGHAASVFDVTFSPDGKTMATASADKTTKLWNAMTGEELRTLYASDALMDVDFSPDGSQLAAASRDGTNRIYLLRIEDLIELAKQRVTRSLTTEECQQYLHVQTCPTEP